MRLNDRTLSLACPLNDLRTLTRRFMYQVDDPLSKALSHLATQPRAVLFRVSSTQPLEMGLHERDELCGDRFVYDDALGRHADLALVQERALGDRASGFLEVGVRQNLVFYSVST